MKFFLCTVLARLRSLWSCILITGMLVYSALPCKAQEFWTGITLRAKLTKMLSVDLEQQVRFNETIGQYKSTFTEAGLRVRPWPHVGAALAYRYTDRPGSSRADDNDRQRWSGDVFYTVGSSKTQWLFAHRLRYQNARTFSDEQDEPKTYLRNRFLLAYNLTKRVQPYLSFESFYRLNDKNEIQLNRFTMGLETQIGKPFTLEVFYRVEGERNVKYPERVYVIGLTGTYRFPFRKGKSGELEDGIPIKL